MASERQAQVRSHKTEAIMKLLTGGNIALNPMLDNEFKQAVFSLRRENEPIKKPAEPQKKVLPAEINITTELITEMLPQILQRFGCCKCNICFAEAMSAALDTIEPIKVKIRSEADVKRADALKIKHRSGVMSALVKLGISRRSLPKHNK